jgi:hypothetical protein
MAKIEYGPMVAQASGSVGGTTFSRNRYGAYTRAKTLPVNPATSYQAQTRAYLSTAAQLWGYLTPDQRLQWQTWAANNPIIDRLGKSQTLAPNTAFIQINSRILYMDQEPITTPPVLNAPIAILSPVLTGDIGPGDITLAFDDSELGPNDRLWLRFAVTNSTGVTYVKNLLRLVTGASEQATSPYDYQNDLEARFGSLQVGQTVHCLAAIADSSTGLISPPRPLSVVVTDTTP